MANIEGRVDDLIERYDLVILEGVAAHAASDREDRRILHAVGDGTFTTDGQSLDQRNAMRAKLPENVLLYPFKGKTHGTR